MPHRDLQGDGPPSCLDENLVASRTSGLPIGQKMRLDRHLHQRNRNSCYLSRSVLRVKKNLSYLGESQNIKIPLKPSGDGLPSSPTCEFFVLLSFTAGLICPIDDLALNRHSSCYLLFV